jgi:hypothetical protein
MTAFAFNEPQHSGREIRTCGLTFERGNLESRRCCALRSSRVTRSRRRVAIVVEDAVGEVTGGAANGAAGVVEAVQ